MTTILVDIDDRLVIAILHNKPFELNVFGFNYQSRPPTLRCRILKVAKTEVNVSKLRDYLKCRV